MVRKQVDTYMAASTPADNDDDLRRRTTFVTDCNAACVYQSMTEIRVTIMEWLKTPESRSTGVALPRGCSKRLLRLCLHQAFDLMSFR